MVGREREGYGGDPLGELDKLSLSMECKVPFPLTLFFLLVSKCVLSLGTKLIYYYWGSRERTGLCSEGQIGLNVQELLPCKVHLWELSNILVLTLQNRREYPSRYVYSRVEQWQSGRERNGRSAIFRKDSFCCGGVRSVKSTLRGGEEQFKSLYVMYVCNNQSHQCY